MAAGHHLENHSISKTVGPTSAEYGVLKGYKSTETGNGTADINIKNNNLSIMLTAMDQKLQKS